MKYQGLKKVALLSLIVLMALSVDVMAQRGRGMGMQQGLRGQGLQQNDRGYGPGQGMGYYCENIPDLTEEQSAQIQELRLTHFTEQQTYRNEMGELQAKRRTLIGSNATMADLDKNTDSITSLQNKMMKNQQRHREAVRNLLTKDQQVYFDSHYNRGHRMGRGYARGAGRGMGMNACGRGRGNW